MTGSLFGVLLALSGAAVALWVDGLIRRHRRAQQWPKVPAVIVKSDLRVTEDGDGTSYRAEFVYAYTVDGKAYQSGAHSRGSSLHGDPEKEARERVASRPVGSVVVVAVDPDDPTSALLDTGVPERLIAIRRACVAMVVVGSVVLLYAVFA